MTDLCIERDQGRCSLPRFENHHLPRVLDLFDPFHASDDDFPVIIAEGL